ncbi:MAG: hypothetical protein M1819_002352 [Sarea resinae]|nr:MAG: hypothetical protein M1819_002352 [Sarea resinae]
MLSTLLLAAITGASIVYARCECGYRLQDTDAYYTYLLTSNFTNYTDATALNSRSANFSTDWTVQSWSSNATQSDPFPRTYSESNVFIQDGVLVMRQGAYSVADREANRSVSIAAIVSKRDDFLHGSFRAVFNVSEDRGSVGGFFWYHDNDNEIDIEVLTKEANDTTIHYTTHPSVDSRDNPIPGASTAETLMLPWTELQEHRFDWSKNSITFFENSRALHNTTVNIPRVGGSVQMNLWADGSQWSGTPSLKNVTMNVQSIQIFYNTTDSEDGTDKGFNSACNVAGGPSHKTVCKVVDDEVKSSDARMRMLETASWSWTITALLAWMLL